MTDSQIIISSFLAVAVLTAIACAKVHLHLAQWKSGQFLEPVDIERPVSHWPARYADTLLHRNEG